jgi:dUTP pyrophosphatase
MENLKVKIKKVRDNATIPNYAHAYDGCVDLTAAARDKSPLRDKNGSIWTYHTGLALEIPQGYVGLIFPRSSISKTAFALANCVGVIDSGYRGEIMVKFREHTPGKIYNVGDRIGQLMIVPRPKVVFNVVEELGDSFRGEGSFGSTGK